MIKFIRTVISRTDVVFRLRLAFGMIALLLCTAALVGRIQLLSLQESQSQAIQYSVPALVESQEIARYLTDISDLTARLSTENSSEKVHDLKAALIKRYIQLTILKNSATVVPDHFDTNSDRAKISLNQLNTAILKIVPIKLNILSINESISTKLNKVAQLRGVFNQLIEPLSIDLASHLSNSLGSASNSTVADIPSSNQDLRNQVADQYQLLEISYRMSALLDTIENLSPHNNEIDRVEETTNLEISFRNIVQNLIHFYDLESRNNLADVVKDLRSLVFGIQGILADISSFIEHESEFVERHHSLLTLINNISNEMEYIVSNAEYDIESSLSTFNQNLENIIVALGVTGFLVLSLVALISYYVVERQINRRMSTLTTAVTDIAAGDTNRIVDIEGNDEIAAMANALEIFKYNAEELQRSNKELEQFAYAASHDLKSPLRAIENLAQWTLEDAGDQLPPESKNNLTQLVSRAQRLSRLQSDLLEYSRAGKVDSDVYRLDINKITIELAELLDPENRFKFLTSQFPSEISTHITPLRQVLLNLVNNAIKHHDKQSGVIEINAKMKNQKLIVSVSDDGPGIAREYHEKIFGLFERLESQDSVEGSGLGLSLVKKIVERSKGTICVFSEPDTKRGSKFEFDWPIIDH